MHKMFPDQIQKEIVSIEKQSKFSRIKTFINWIYLDDSDTTRTTLNCTQMI